MRRPIHKRLYATFESHAALFKWLHHEAVKRGYGTKRTLFLADGAEAIWDQQARWFPKAESCIDWVHIVEKLWTVGRCLHREGSDQLAAWVRDRVRELRRPSGADKVSTALSVAYAAIAKTGPGNKAKREKLLEVLTHIGKHRHRMRYHALRRDDIATGIIEGAIRSLVRMRLDGPGMRWSRGVPSGCSICDASCSTVSGTISPRISLIALRFSSLLRRHRRDRTTPRRGRLDHAIRDLHPIGTVYLRMALADFRDRLPPLASFLRNAANHRLEVAVSG